MRESRPRPGEQLSSRLVPDPTLWGVMEMRQMIATEIDGVPTFWAPCEGPLQGQLAFRVGTADESYVSAGRSHIVEHLALFGLPDPSRHNNGFVDQTVTAFSTTGDDAEVAEFITTVAGRLGGGLPLDRLEPERGVLAAERAQRKPSIDGLMTTWRFGAQGFGLGGNVGTGEKYSTADQVVAWAAERFTRANAVLTLSGPPPAGLHIGLPDGQLYPAPAPHPLVPGGRPHWFPEDIGGTAFSALMPRTTPTTVLPEALRELLTRLRVEHALSYSPWVSYEKLGPDWAHVTAFADSNPDRRMELVSAFAQLVGSLSQLSDENVAATRDRILEQRDQSMHRYPQEHLLAQLTAAAHDSLHGGRTQTREALTEELWAVQPAAVREAARLLESEALFCLPPDALPPSVCGARLPMSFSAPVYGRARRSAHDRSASVRLVVGEDGVTVKDKGAEPLTVRYDAMVGAHSFPDGAITLVGHDSVHLNIEPRLWTRGRKAVAGIREHVEPSLIIHAPARAPENIPPVSGFTFPAVVLFWSSYAMLCLTVMFRHPDVGADLVLLGILATIVYSRKKDWLLRKWSLHLDRRRRD